MRNNSGLRVVSNFGERETKEQNLRAHARDSADTRRERSPTSPARSRVFSPLFCLATKLETHSLDQFWIVTLYIVCRGQHICRHNSSSNSTTGKLLLEPILMWKGWKQGGPAPLSLQKPPRRVSAMPCWWVITRPQQLSMAARYLLGWYGCGHAYTSPKQWSIGSSKYGGHRMFDPCWLNVTETHPTLARLSYEVERDWIYKQWTLVLTAIK